ncbi:hypothetical protein GGR56DRAFT_678819 [Xylariaceae sp. FL0804]|nr:hypothetical protein GGR56DRAFT_678819 [Xylariaceae sp. FL0804]
MSSSRASLNGGARLAPSFDFAALRRTLLARLTAAQAEAATLDEQVLELVGGGTGNTCTLTPGVAGRIAAQGSDLNRLRTEPQEAKLRPGLDVPGMVFDDSCHMVKRTLKAISGAIGDAIEGQRSAQPIGVLVEAIAFDDRSAEAAGLVAEIERKRAGGGTPPTG